LADKIGQLNLLAAGQGQATGAGGGGDVAERIAARAVGGVFGIKSMASAYALQRAAVDAGAVPLMFAEDVIHGHRTIFPLPIALASSWDMDLIERTAAFAAAEARQDGIHQVYAPMIDIARDPRWGRVAESPGEDPTLASAYARAMVRGLQGDDFAGPGRVAACLKHFLAYGAPTSGRDYDNVSMSAEDLFGVYAAPFIAGLSAGAPSVMVSFNAVNKLPMHANAGLIEGWLRGARGFDGLVVSDYTGVAELVAHGMGDRRAAVARALHAGVDMDMVGEDYLAALPDLAANGIDDPETGLRLSGPEICALIDRACLRVLKFKARLGLLADPFRGLIPDSLADRAPSAAGRALAREAAAKSAVLLQNRGALPLAPGARVALVGPLADDRYNMLGTWSVGGDAAQAPTLREALTGRVAALSHAHGADLVSEPWLADRLNIHGPSVAADPRGEAAMIAEAVALGCQADVIVAAVGEAREHAGESSSRLSPDLPAPQLRLLDALAATGRPVVAVVFAGRPLALADVAARCDALLLMWHGGTEGATGVADVLLGAVQPSGRLASALPAHPGQTPLHHSAEATGRPFPGVFAKFRTGWLDMQDGPDHVAGLFPFGFGLGYQPLRYGPPRVDRAEASGEDGVIMAEIEVTNLGDQAVIETVQLYLSDPVARITRPERELKAFTQLALAPGATATARFRIDAGMLRYAVAAAADGVAMVWDPGAFTLRLGADSRDAAPVAIRWAR
jgi:beta-glucosidase